MTGHDDAVSSACEGIDGEGDAFDQVILMIVVEHVDGNGDKAVSKIRMRLRDLPDSSPHVTGKLLHTFMLAHIGMDHNTFVEVYDSHDRGFYSLHPDLGETDIVSRFGKCIRCTASKSPSQHTRLAITGRFYPYDADKGMEFAGTRLCVQERPNVPGAGTGLNVWDGAMLLARYLEQRPDLVRSKRVLELGSGCGLVGIAAGILGAKDVVLTDLPYCLPLMRANVEDHRADLLASGCQRIECNTCDWFDPPAMDKLGASCDWEPDIVLIADCVWVQELVTPLLSTLEKLIACRSTRVIISYQRRGKATHEDFWSGIHSLFDVVLEPDISHMGIKKPDCLHLLDCRTANGFDGDV